MTRIWAFALFLVGLSFDGDTLSDAVAGLVVTFFGLLAAAILTALSLLVANTISPGLSVSKTQELNNKLVSLVGKLVTVLGLLLMGATAAIIHRIGLPDLGKPTSWVWYFNMMNLHPNIAFAFEWVSECVNELPSRSAQSLVFVAFVLCLDRMRIVPTAFRRVLNASYNLAITDSQRRLKLAAPTDDDLRSAFPTPPNHGERKKRKTPDN